MRWSNSEAAWEARHSAVEAVMRLLERGRLCQSGPCTARSEIAFEVEIEGARGLVGMCAHHGPIFAADHSTIIRGRPRLLDDEAILSPPFTEIEGDDVVHEDGGDLDEVYDREPETPKAGRRSKKSRRKTAR